MSIPSTRRESAGTLIPASITIKSPTTISDTGQVFDVPLYPLITCTFSFLTSSEILFSCFYCIWRQKAIKRLISKQAIMMEKPSSQALGSSELKRPTRIWKAPAANRIFSSSSYICSSQIDLKGLIAGSILRFRPKNLLRLLRSFSSPMIPVVTLVPSLSPRPLWWPTFSRIFKLSLFSPLFFGS